MTDCSQRSVVVGEQRELARFHLKEALLLYLTLGDSDAVGDLLDLLVQEQTWRPSMSSPPASSPQR